MAKINVCIDKSIIDQIKKENLNVSTEQRALILNKYLGEEDAFKFSKLFERAKTLKNEELAYQRLLDDVQGLNADKKAQLTRNIQEEIQRKRELLYNSDGSINENFKAVTNYSPDEWRANTKKIFDSKYKIDIPDEKIAQITNLRRLVDSYPVGSEEHAAAQLKLAAAIDEVKNPTNTLGFTQTLKYEGKQIASEFKNAKGVIPKTSVALRSVSDILSSAAYRAVKATMDLSFGLNQGYKIFLDSPTNWGKSFVESMKGLKGLGKEEVMDAFKIKMMTDPQFDQALKDGVRLGGVEEYFANTLFSKIPGLKTLINTSDHAFTMFIQNARFNVYKGQMKAFNVAQDILKQQGKELNGKELKAALNDIAEVANSITGSGSFGSGEKYINGMNKLFFAPRYTKSTIDTVIMPFKGLISGKEFNRVARIRSAKLLGKQIGSFLLIGGGIAAVAPDRIEMNPLSPKFGKVRVSGDKWIPFGGPLPTYISTLTRFLTGKTMNAAGEVTELNTSKYGAKSRLDVATNFAKNKLAPVPSVITQAYLTGKNYKGEPYDINDLPDELLTPISLGNIFEMAQTNPDLFEAIMLGAGEMGGLSSTDYEDQKTSGPFKSVINKIKGN